MSTRSRIAFKSSHGEIFSIYCHYDGYETGVGACLIEKYNDFVNALRLCTNGNISTMIGSRLDANKEIEHYALGFEELEHYKGEHSVIHKDLKSLLEYFEQSDQEYLYVFSEKDSKWHYYKLDWKVVNNHYGYEPDDYISEVTYKGLLKDFFKN